MGVLRREGCEGRGHCLVRGRCRFMRVLGFPAVHGDAGSGRGARTSSAGRQQHLPSHFHQAWGLGCARSRDLLLTPATPPELPEPGAPSPSGELSGELEAGGPSLPSAHLAPTLRTPTPGWPL